MAAGCSTRWLRRRRWRSRESAANATPGGSDDGTVENAGDGNGDATDATVAAAENAPAETAEPVADDTPASGAESVETVHDVVPVENLSLEEALALAAENNSDIKNSEKNWRKAIIEADQAYRAAKDIEEAQNLTFARIKYLNKNTQAKGKTLAEKTYQASLETINLQVKQKYYSVLEAAELIEVCRGELERAQKQLKNAEVAFQVGTVAKTDVLSAQVGYANAQAALTQAENTLSLAKLELNKTMGVDLHNNYELTTKVEYIPMEAIDLNKVIEEAFNTRLDVIAAQIAKEIADENYDLIKGYTAPDTFDAKTAKIDADIAGLNLEDARENVIKDLTSAYLNINAMEKTLQSLNAAEEQARENMRLVQLRYEVGMATTIDVLDASVQLSNVQAKRVNALYGYDLAKLTFATAKLAPISF